MEAACAEAGAGKPSSEAIGLAIDHLSVNLGRKILGIVPGYVSTEVDIRLSFDAMASEARARRIIALYEAAGVPRSRVLIKLAGTWEGIRCAEALEKDGIRTNITLVFGVCQGVAAAQAGCTLISPFPGRVLEWTKFDPDGPKGPQVFKPSEDPGVVACAAMYAYFRKHGHDTICMPASWRSSTGEDMLDEIRALAGTDRMTIPPPLLEQLAACEDPLPRVLEPSAAAASCAENGALLCESAFRCLAAGPDTPFMYPRRWPLLRAQSMPVLAGGRWPVTARQTTSWRLGSAPSPRTQLDWLRYLSPTPAGTRITETQVLSLVCRRSTGPTESVPVSPCSRQAGQNSCDALNGSGLHVIIVVPERLTWHHNV